MSTRHMKVNGNDNSDGAYRVGMTHCQTTGKVEILCIGDYYSVGLLIRVVPHALFHINPYMNT